MRTAVQDVHKRLAEVEFREDGRVRREDRIEAKGLKASACSPTPDDHAVSESGTPGVGAITALSPVAVIREVERLADARRLAGYLGLDPLVRRFGDRPARAGHSSRAGRARAAPTACSSQRGHPRRDDPGAQP